MSRQSRLIGRSLRRVSIGLSLIRGWGLVPFLQEIGDRLNCWLFSRGLLPQKVLFPSEFSVSVVVPTRNGGSELIDLLDSLLRQRGVRLEIVVVDSSSTDGTRTVLEERGITNVLTIAPSQFSHSGTRNLGVRAASFSLVLLTVQDAVFPEELWLYRLCCLLESSSLAAVSTVESPRDSADKYARWEISTYRRSLGLDQTTTHITVGSPRNRRNRYQAASLGNVACLYRRQVLLDQPFTGTFGEDLRQGLLLLKLGLRTAITSELQVIHSHVRPAFYVLRRQYASRVLLHDLRLLEPKGRHRPDFAHRLVMDFLEYMAGRGWVLEKIDQPLALWLNEFLDAGILRPVNRSVQSGWRASLIPQDNDDPVYLAKTFAAHLGATLGSIRSEDWSRSQQILVEGLAKGV